VPLSRLLSVTARVLSGVLAALVCVELALRAFITPGALPLPSIRADSFDDPSIEWRQIDEGIATSHFTVHGARLTGHAPARGGNTAVIIGDSYVVAEQVGDRQTMGARLETLARESGIPLDVRQYGWPGASPAQYLYVAADIRDRWQPSRVFVVLSSNDFDKYGLVQAAPRFRVDTAGRLRIIGDRMAGAAVPRRGSRMMKAVRHRWVLIERRFVRRAAAREGRSVALPEIFAIAPAELPPDSLELERAPGAVVRALGRAYGPALTVVYLAEAGVRGDSVPDRAEALMLSACAAAAVDCVSTRPAMAAAVRAGKASHGLGIAPLGNGHLNRAGHAVVGRVMWERLARATFAAR
jgi:hypothetical protein